MTTPPNSALPFAPFRIEPAFVGRVWGYTDLRPWYDRTTPSEPIGEVWLTGDQCIAATGPHAGERLGDIFRTSREQLLGAGAPDSDSPLLIKVLFAREKLSVQVHPDDALAQKYGQPRGKTECWYALSAEPGAQVALGLKPGVTLESVRAAIEGKTLESDLNLVSVSTGDMIYVDAGTVHAIWPGSIILEVQQNSDITYRLYDYGRPRELHVDKGLEATRFDTRAGKVAPQALADRLILLDSRYFLIEQLRIKSNQSSCMLVTSEASATSNKQPGLAYLFAAEGQGRIVGAGFEPVELPARSIVCVPAASPDFTLEPQGVLDLIRITPKWDSHVPSGKLP